MKPLPIYAIAFSLICVAAAVLWHGRIQVIGTTQAVFIVDRWADTVRMCGYYSPNLSPIPESAVLVNCSPPYSPYWPTGVSK